MMSWLLYSTYYIDKKTGHKNVKDKGFLQLIVPRGGRPSWWRRHGGRNMRLVDYITWAVRKQDQEVWLSYKTSRSTLGHTSFSHAPYPPKVTHPSQVSPLAETKWTKPRACGGHATLKPQHSSKCIHL